MGNCAPTEIEYSKPNEVDEFKKLYPIGQGTYGKVWKIIHKPTDTAFALKEMNKSLILSKKSVASIMNERKFLGMLENPFIVNMHYAFQDRENLYLILDMMAGGDLRFFFKQSINLTEESLKFMSACIVSSLEYLYSNNIIHRDLKPENLVFDANGYLHLTDFGIARTTDMDNKGITSGSLGYMAPETICMQDQSFDTDYFALGVILFEAITGKRPYRAKNRKEMREAMLAKQVKLPLGGDWSVEFRNFVDKLIQRKPKKRLGYRGIEEIKTHPWFDGFEWEKLYAKALESPFKICGVDNFEYKQVSEKSDFPTNNIGESLATRIFTGFNFYSSVQF